MWKYNGQTIRAGKSWRDDNGVLHPKNWNIWSSEYKASMGITEIIPETPPDSRLYIWSMNSDGTINKKAKDLNDVKLNLIKKVKGHQGSYLSQTDWAIVRKVDIGTEVPANIQTWRDAIRTRATEMETAIEGAADIDAVAELFVVHRENEDGDIIKSGILYDWPEKEEEYEKEEE